MARQAGPQYLIGKIGNLIYYKRGGEYFVKSNGAPTREQLKKGKNYKKTRESNVEFSGGAVVGKTFRDTFSSLIEIYSNQSLSPKLTGLFKTMISKGSGKEGMRSLAILPHKNDLIGFEFHKDYLFKKIFRAPMKWKIEKGRKGISLVIPNFKPSGFVSKPMGASHFRITLGVGIISDYIYSQNKMKYIPLNDPLNKKTFTIYSDYINVLKPSVEITLPVRFKSMIPDAYSVVALIGIQFYKNEAGEMHELETKRALQIVEVF